MTLYVCLRRSELPYYRQAGMEPVAENGAVVRIKGEYRRYVRAYLSTEDCPGRDDPDRVTAAVEVVAESCYIAEGAFDSMDPGAPDCLPELFESSVMPLTEYRLGYYRQPVCLVPGTDETLAYLNERPSSPSPLYDYSGEMYGERRLEDLRGLVSTDELLELACRRLAETGRAKVTVSDAWPYALYETDGGQKIIIRRHPE